MLIDEQYAPRIPAGLTRLAAKEDLFAVDSLFWEGWEDLAAIAGPDATRTASAHTLVLLKPDAVVGRRLHVAIEWLDRAGFHIAHAEQVVLSPAQIRLMWQYQWNIARRERKDACDLLLTATPSLLLFLRGPSDGAEAATLLFTRLKGPADPDARKPGELRFALGRRSTLLNFIHSADEPADIPREAAILLPEPLRRRAALLAMRDGADGRAAALRIVERLYDRTVEHDLLLDGAVARLRSRARQVALTGAIGRWFAAFDETGSGDWRHLFEELDRHGVTYAMWDKITVSAHLITMDDERYKLLIPGLKLIDANDARVAAGPARGRG